MLFIIISSDYFQPSLCSHKYRNFESVLPHSNDLYYIAPHTRFCSLDSFDFLCFIAICFSNYGTKTNFVTDARINLPKKQGIVVELFLNSTICFTLVIHPSFLIFENGKNNAVMLFKKINSGICHEVTLKMLT